MKKLFNVGLMSFLLIITIAISVLITDVMSNTVQASPQLQNSPQVVITKPALPKVVRHKYLTSPAEMDNYIIACVHDGYKITIVVNDSAADISYWYVVAEKY